VWGKGWGVIFCRFVGRWWLADPPPQRSPTIAYKVVWFRFPYKFCLPTTHIASPINSVCSLKQTALLPTTPRPRRRSQGFLCLIFPPHPLFKKKSNQHPILVPTQNPKNPGHGAFLDSLPWRSSGAGHAACRRRRGRPADGPGPQQGRQQDLDQVPQLGRMRHLHQKRTLAYVPVVPRRSRVGQRPLPVPCWQWSFGQRWHRSRGCEHCALQEWRRWPLVLVAQRQRLLALRRWLLQRREQGGRFGHLLALPAEHHSQC